MLPSPFAKFRLPNHATVVAYLGLFVALGGTGAYAANTIRSSDIVDGEIGSADVKDNSLNTFDVHSFIGEDVIDGTLTNADIKDFSLGNGDFIDGSVNGRVVTDNSLTGFDITDGQIGQVDLADGTVNSAKVADNTLTGTDINESTLNLNLPPATAVAFAGPAASVVLGLEMRKVAGKNVPAGSYAISATANVRGETPCFGTCDTYRDVTCELRGSDNNFVGGARDRRMFHDQGSVVWRSLSMNGGAQVPSGGGEVSLWCNTDGFEAVEYAQMMILRVGSFF